MARTINSAIDGTVNLAQADNPSTVTNTGNVTATALGADAADRSAYQGL